MDPTIQAVINQAFAKSHTLSLAQADRENSANGNIGEQTRLGFLEMKTGADIADQILSQRSVSQQPQVGVIPAAVPISKAA